METVELNTHHNCTRQPVPLFKPSCCGVSPCVRVFAARTRITKAPQDQSVIKGTKAVMTCGVTHDQSVSVM